MKTIYSPKGKAGEYATYAVNFYNGCSNGCEYCYLKMGALAGVLGGDMPSLQKKYKNEDNALSMFITDIQSADSSKLKERGIFFTFSSDPFLKETMVLNFRAIEAAVISDIPCVVLTKCAESALAFAREFERKGYNKRSVAMGFTLTGHDELEPNADSNLCRIAALGLIYKMGFRTWASIEPVIDVESSMNMIRMAEPFCEHFKVGLRSRVKREYYNDDSLLSMYHAMERDINRPIYLKDSFVDRLMIDRENIGEPFVGRCYNLFKQEYRRS